MLKLNKFRLVLEQGNSKITKNARIFEIGHHCKLKLITLSTIPKSEFKKLQKTRSEAQKPSGKKQARKLSSLTRIFRFSIVQNQNSKQPWLQIYLIQFAAI